ncbi:hypothetical protein B0H17DRAFT_1261183 [Mycena rosella]|uniref:Protein kinase domain-containing protein n=1 Tax=Mycena rosella TaxID=1033263 RepID=A0AAD7DTQ0_MYCRO|nr:hypothetical protein B0H17DRAFT_1261183 [Mycena rosella]
MSANRSVSLGSTNARRKPVRLMWKTEDNDIDSVEDVDGVLKVLPPWSPFQVSLSCVVILNGTGFLFVASRLGAVNLYVYPELDLQTPVARRGIRVSSGIGHLLPKRLVGRKGVAMRKRGGEMVEEREEARHRSLFGTDSWLDAELKLRGMPAIFCILEYIPGPTLDRVAKAAIDEKEIQDLFNLGLEAVREITFAGLLLPDVRGPNFILTGPPGSERMIRIDLGNATCVKLLPLAVKIRGRCSWTTWLVAIRTSTDVAIGF